MQVSVLNQRAGEDTVSDALAAVLREPAYDRMRVLMAFARGPGIGLLIEPLTDFFERGGTAEAIVGLDLGGTSPEALESLVGLGVDCFVFGVKGDRTFHPKVSLFDGAAGKFAVVVGSSNWTPGGLDSNFEACVLIEGDRGRSEDDSLMAELETLWSTYREPAAPMEEGRHLRRLDSNLLAQLAERLPSDRSPAPDQRESSLSDELFDGLEAPRAPLRRAPRRRGGGDTTEIPAEDALPKTLYLEVTGAETGGLREIQVPVDTLGEYFGIGRDDSYYMTFRHSDGTQETNRPLAIYLVNTTFRISSSKFRDVPLSERPIIVKLDRLDEPDTFAVSIIRNDTPEYAEAEQYLTRGGGGTKRWGPA